MRASDGCAPRPGAVAALLVLLAAGCASGWAAGRGDERAVRGLEHDPTMLTSTDWLADHLGDPDLVVLHVTHRKDTYAIGHVPGARLLPWEEIATTRGGIPNELPPAEELVRTFARHGVRVGERVVLYDDEGGLAAARAWTALDYIGRSRHASLLDGQLALWRAESRPLDTGLPPVATLGHVRPAIDVDVLVSLPVVRDLSWWQGEQSDAAVALVDARPPEEYSGAVPGDGIERPGHIPGAVSIPWTANLVSEADPQLRPVADLRRLWESRGVDPQDLVVTYCRTGGQASFDYFVARYLGYDVRLYDGSFFEWSHAEDTEVRTGDAPR